MTVIELEQVTTHRDVPTTYYEDATQFRPSSEPGVSKHRADLGEGAHLDALLLNRESDVLVVTFHGATRRDRYEIPRFEWFRTLRDTPWSVMCFSDPALSRFPELSLGWFTGWGDVDGHQLIANWVTRTADAIGARTIVLTGSSGGGFAALKIAPLVPGSIAVPFNPQVSIADYLVKDTNMGAQRSYVRDVMPHLAPPGGVNAMVAGGGYFDSVECTSAYPTWNAPHDSFVWYLSNVNDTHHHLRHFEPFRDSVMSGPNSCAAVFKEYEGPTSHNPPPRALFKREIADAISHFGSGVHSDRGAN